MKVFAASRYGLIRHATLQRLKRHFSVAYEPYYLIREGERRPGMHWPELPEGYSASIVTPETAYKVVGLAPWFTEQSMEWRLSGGHVCIVVEHDEIGTVACTWANPKKLHDHDCDYELAPDEAYLYDAFVHEKARGQRLAPAMRVVSYDHLSKLGYTRFVSVSDKYNLPALKFKGRLGAEIFSYVECMRIGDKTLLNFRRPTRRALPT